jgi:DNA-binding MurR/RpiR family transcriptional regulator
VERLAAKYAQLTPSQRLVAEIIIREPARLAFLSSEEVASQAQVSDTTVVRLATRLGYRGYSDLQRALQTAITQEMFPRDHLRRTLKDGNEDVVVSRLMEVDEISIRATRTELDPAMVQQAAERLYRAGRVAVLGLRSSFAVAYYLYLRLLEVRSNVALLGQTQGTLVEAVGDLGREDLLVAISFARYTSATVECARTAWREGVPVLAITDSPLSPLTSVATQVLLVRADDVPAAAVSALSLCGALVVAAGRVDPVAVQSRQARIEAALKRANMFHETTR